MPSSPVPEGPAQELFASVHYTIASSLPVQRADQLRHILDINGALYAEKGLSDPSLNTIITNSNRFEGWENVAERQGVRVVSDKWVERSVILGKMQPAQYFSPDPSMIFSGIAACATDLPATDLEVLSAGVTALGGQWRTGLTRDVTHLFALTPDSVKYATAMHYREETGIRVVLPHWFDDAVRLGMGNLPTKPYEWPDPELLKGPDGQIFEKGNIKAKGKAALAELEQNDVKRNMYATAVIFTPTLGRSSPPTESDLSLVLSKVPGPSNEPSGLNIKQMQVWKGRKIILSRTLELYKGRREAVQAGIERAGGVVLRFEGDGDEPEPLADEKRQGREKVSKKERIRRRNEAQRVAECDVLVTRWRHGRAYVRACQGGKTVGTLAWLFHVQSSGVLSNPQDQLLHYPVPKRSIEAFSKHVITVTNYTGEAREYIKKLIAAMGATFTPSMSGENTALIAAYIGGTKADKAQSWSIPIVNHTWLEDCFMQWRNLTMALEKYIVFPRGVDFSSLLGERGVGVGDQIVNEVEELATMVFEEDAEYLSDNDEKDGAVDDNHRDVDMPNGTEGSVKEVARGLVGGDETVPRSKPQSKNTNFKPPEGMDIHFEPPSTAAVVANHTDWSVDVDLDDDPDARSGVPDQDDHEADGPVKSKKSAKVSLREAAATTRSRRVSRKSRQENQDEDVKNKEVSTRRKARTVSEEEVELDDEQSVVESKKIVKAKSKAGKQVEEVVELDSEDELPKKKGKGKEPRRNIVASDEEEEETTEDENRRPKTTNSKSTVLPKSVKTRRTDAQLQKASNAVKVKVAPPVSNSDADETPHQKHRKLAAMSPHISSRSKTVVKDVHETEDYSVPAAEEKPKSGLRRKLTVEVVMTTPPKGKGRAQQRNDNTECMPESKKGKSTSVPGAKKTAVRSEGLLKKVKGDARTRIKRKSIPKGGNVSVESEEEDSVVVHRLQDRRKEEEEEEERRPSKTKLKTQPSASTNTNKHVRSKPLQVYSSEGVESEDDELSSEVDGGVEEPASDDDLPDTIDLPSGPRTKPRHVVRTSAKATTSTRANQSTVVKRPISVLSPSLTISPAQKARGKKKVDHDAGDKVVHRPKTSNSKKRTSVSDSEDADQDEVDESISLRTRSGLTKASVKSKDVIKEKKHRTSEPRKASKVERPAVEPMEVDDGHNSRSSPASASVPSMAVPRRNAAAKASQRLHDTLMPDLVNFEAQMKKAKGKGRQSVGMDAFALESEEDREQDVGKRKKTVHMEEGGDGSDEEAQPRKKRRVSDENQDTVKAKGKAKGRQKAKEESVEVEENQPSSGNVVLLTTQVTLSDDVLKSLAKLGVRMTTRPSECTHLLAPHLVRTEKFLCALAHAPFILSAKWATASAAAKTLLPEKDFILKDPTGEKKFDVNLVHAVRRAKANKGMLLEGMMFYLTPRVGVDKKLLKNVVNACGGDITTQPPSLRIIRAAPENRHVISCKEDISIWRPIAVEGYKIYSQELLLAGIMKQKFEWDREEYMVEG